MNNTAHWHSVSDKNALAKSLAKAVADKLINLIKKHGEAQLFVSGGQSPVQFFQLLSEQKLEWNKVSVALVDERCVPHSHDDSNTRLVQTHLLINAAAAAKWHDVVNSAGEPFDLPLVPNETSIAVLGMGEDSHTASLFPDAENILLALDLQQKQNYLIVEPKHAVHKRITLSAAALVKFQQLYLLIQGDKKRAVLEHALREANAAHPIGFLIKHAGCSTEIYWSP